MALGLVGQVYVLKFGKVPTCLYLRLQLWCEFLLFRYRLCYRLLPLLYFLETFVLFCNERYLYLIEVSRALFAITGNEWNGASLVEQC